MAPPTGPSKPNRNTSAYTSRRDPPRRDPYPPQKDAHRHSRNPDPKRNRPPPTGPASSIPRTAPSHQQAPPKPRERTKTPEPIRDPVPDFDIDAVGPHPGYICRTQRFVSESTIHRKLKKLGTDLKDEQWRIQGVSCLDAACRSGLGIPLATVSTAVAFFHRFRLENSLDQYHLVEVVASALYLASKVENTARKPNEIAAACLHVNVPVIDRRVAEDEFFDAMQDRIVDIERLMLEATSFEFKIFDPKRLMFKILTDDLKMHYGVKNADHDHIYKLALNISKDLNYTFALIKQFHGTNAVACVELAFRLLDRGMNFDAAFRPGKPIDPNLEAALDREESRTGLKFPELRDPQNPYRRYFTSRTEVLETIMDLLDLYTVHRTVTFAGPAFTNEQIMQVKIAFNRTAQRYDVPRYANDVPGENEGSLARNYVSKLKLERDFIVETAQPETTAESNGVNGDVKTESALATQTTERKAVIAVRRFVLQASDAQRERKMLDEYYLVKNETYDGEHEEEDGWESVSDSDDERDADRRSSRR